MPWKACSVMEERLRFVARLLDGEGMSDLCREFGISRKTGYKIYNRYKDEGLEALSDRLRRPVRYANQLPEPIERMIVRCKKDKPHWGARKIRELLVKRLAGDVRIPAKSTVHAVLDRHGLVARARKRRNRAEGTALSNAFAPNDLWCADFKGEFKLGNGRYCYPLTVLQGGLDLFAIQGPVAFVQTLALGRFVAEQALVLGNVVVEIDHVRDGPAVGGAGAQFERGDTREDAHQRDPSAGVVHCQEGLTGASRQVGGIRGQGLRNPERGQGTPLFGNESRLGGQVKGTVPGWLLFFFGRSGGNACACTRYRTGEVSPI